MADAAHEVITDGWKSAVAGQLSTALGAKFWRAVPRRQHKRPTCRNLAALANAIESAQQWAHDAVGAMADHGLSWLGRPTLERRIAEAFAKKIPIPGEEALPPIIHALRVVGVWVCAENGRDVITECPCFLSLAKEKSTEALKEILLAKLDDLTDRRVE
ncbi:MAG: hypothetical protein ACRDRH_03965 [Pseudonocardia sp.]